MKVRATQKGYYAHQIKYPGEVFELVDQKVLNDKGEEEVQEAEDQFSATWMETLDGKEFRKVGISVPKPGANQSVDGKEDPNRVLNQNISDNQRTMDEVVMAHGGEQDPEKVKLAKKGKSVI